MRQFSATAVRCYSECIQGCDFSAKQNKRSQQTDWIELHHCVLKSDDMELMSRQMAPSNHC